MRTRALLLTIWCGLLLGCPATLRAAGDDGTPGVEQAEVAPAEHGPGPAQEAGRALALVMILVLFVGAVVTLATAAAVTAAAVFPGATERSREWSAARPWLCLGWGAGVGLFLLVIAAFAGQNLGGFGSTVVLLELLVATLAAAIGFAGIAEWLGLRVFGQLAWRTPGRPVTVGVGGVLFYSCLVTPAGWLAAPFLACLTLGAVRLSLKGLPEPAGEVPLETPYAREQ